MRLLSVLAAVLLLSSPVLGSSEPTSKLRAAHVTPANAHPAQDFSDPVNEYCP